jgi:oxygen-independent coproporphyrinogen-3 oxidase
VGAEAEVTVEANPDDRGFEWYRAVRAIGVNRLSLGVQSFDDAMLGRLGRRHDARAAVEAVELARRAGFDNLSLDLMFALPDQDLAHWEATLDRALALAPDHLSLYNLTVESDTPFGAWAAAGKLTVPDDDLAADMYQAAIDRLGAADYEHYEISNWARRDLTRTYQARHNLRYWRNQPYFGVGAGAHSCFGGFRYANLRAPLKYVRAIEAGRSPVESVEAIDRSLEMAETMMLGLRLAEGISASRFRDRFGMTPDEAYGETLAELRSYGLLRPDPHRVALTERGKFLGNEVFARFLAPCLPGTHVAA